MKLGAYRTDCIYIAEEWSSSFDSKSFHTWNQLLGASLNGAILVTVIVFLLGSQFESVLPD